MDNDPTYEPIIGGHKSYSMEKEMRERGFHATANEIANRGDEYFEGPQGHPAPGSGSPRRDRLSASPQRSSYSPGHTPAAESYGGSPRNSPPQQQQLSYGTGYGSPSGPGGAGGHTTYAPAGSLSQGGVSPPRGHGPVTATQQPSYMSQQPVRSTSPVYAQTQPAYTLQPSYTSQANRAPSVPASQASFVTRSASPTYQETTYAPSQRPGIAGVDNDPSYEPIIGGHKSYSWEKELRERGMHASANDIANQGDGFFEGPQGHPAPGSGSPRRDRVSASPQRSYSPGHTPAAVSYSGSPRSQPPPSYMNVGGPSSSRGASPYQKQSSVPYQPPPSTYQQPPPSMPYQQSPPSMPYQASSSGGSHRYQPPSTAAPTASYTTYQAEGGVSPIRGPGSRSQPVYGASPGPITPSAAPIGGDNDPTYEPIIGGHKSHSMEKEMRERGFHATANEIANRGDEYFEGPQGHPAPGSGSPRRDRVSPSPSRARSTY